MSNYFETWRKVLDNFHHTTAQKYFSKEQRLNKIGEIVNFGEKSKILIVWADNSFFKMQIDWKKRLYAPAARYT